MADAARMHQDVGGELWKKERAIGKRDGNVREKMCGEARERESRQAGK